jgi:hypothetical protein
VWILKTRFDGTIVAPFRVIQRSTGFGEEQAMNRQVTLIVRAPEQIRPGIEAARELAGSDQTPRIVFLCPECASGRACRNLGGSNADSGGSLPPCFADRKKACLPGGFRYAGAGRIARMLRNSDIVIPL